MIREQDRPYTCKCSAVENPFCDGQCFSCILFYEDTRFCFVAGTPSLNLEILTRAHQDYFKKIKSGVA